MARNEEKAQAILNRYVKMKAEQEGKIVTPLQRPKHTSQCRRAETAEKWRNQVLKEISKKVSIIQHMDGMAESTIRQMNDDINELIREKYYWEVRIVELGGVDYRKMVEAEDVKEEGVTVTNDKESGMVVYRYFGAARNLPGVKELFEKQNKQDAKRSRADLYRGINADYYGYRDEDDGVLLPQEEEAEKKARLDLEQEWRESPQGQMGAELDAFNREVQLMEEEPEEAPTFVAHVPLPDKDELEKVVLEKKKQELLKRYVSENVHEAETESKDLLNL
eukprot:GCRY01000630.1.p1 GENE.GCRY01000630.1~~GCRY01000630.1.p1  ORF type:complete len:278 (-),score=58.18 GCRY01000630.1:51-884(-)